MSVAGRTTTVAANVPRSFAGGGRVDPDHRARHGEHFRRELAQCAAAAASRFETDVHLAAELVGTPATRQRQRSVVALVYARGLVAASGRLAGRFRADADRHGLR